MAGIGNAVLAAGSSRGAAGPNGPQRERDRSGMVEQASRHTRPKQCPPPFEHSGSTPTGCLAPDPVASKAPSPLLSLSPPTFPKPELAQFRQKVEMLEHKLWNCKWQVWEVERLLHHTEQLYQSTESNNKELCTQVEELIQQDQNIETSAYNSKDQSQIENDAYAGTDVTEKVECGQEDHFASNSQEPASALATDASLEVSSLAESLRTAAEAAISQVGFSYYEKTGLYFDHSTDFYYDSEHQLYYDPFTGIYYYCDVESGRYQFHSRVDLQPYQTSGTKQSKDKKLKKKRKDPDSSTTNEEKDLNSEDQKASSVEHINCSEGEDCANVKKKAKIDIHYKNSSHEFTIPVIGKTTEFPLNENIYNLTSFKDEKTIKIDSEPEEGEILDSQTEDSYDKDITGEKM
ncbi:Angiogenic factor with G patch and FHA domains 1 [Myotis davidii]|uniref:Angiogenic factor with G patch and FHA domains 1 n=1 Tax=Myotis davidii TaxID=225400 RepID=L5LCJ0_MYODS|nr:Angiogenic factor with G patch and FHA domains 1 [Myotis davidii]